jgi:hypothetical protein
MSEKMCSESHESYLKCLIYLQEYQGLQSPRKLTFVVEATEGCNINLGKCAKRVKSTKFVKQILMTYAKILVISKLPKRFTKSS